MAYWLLKTEPETYSWDDLVRDKRTHWDGVRNYLARNNLAAMKKGDLAFLYHSVGPRDAVGIVEVVKEAYPDPTASDPRWVCVDVVPKKALPRPVTLAEIKANPRLSEMKLVKMSRLSVSPVTKEEWDEVLRMAKEPAPEPLKKKKAAKKAPAKKASTKGTAKKSTQKKTGAGAR